MILDTDCLVTKYLKLIILYEITTLKTKTKTKNKKKNKTLGSLIDKNEIFDSPNEQRKRKAANLEDNEEEI